MRGSTPLTAANLKLTNMYNYKRFKEAAEECGFAVGEPTTQGNATIVTMQQTTPEGKLWILDIDLSGDIEETILEMVDTYDISDTEGWYNEDTCEEETFDSLVDDERWKRDTLTDLYDAIAI